MASAAAPADQLEPSADFPDNRPLAWSLLLAALVIGAALRFYRLGRDELSRGEAAAWTAASAPDLRSVYLAAKHLDPGKAGIYDLMLHGWIRLFGDQVGAMRSLSALLGVASIGLIFLAVRELLLTFDGDPWGRASASLAGALSALLYAVNWQMIATDRTARMYSLMIAAALAQVLCFARVHRRRSIATLIGGALLTDLAVAANFTAVFFFAAEAVWLAWLWLRRPALRTADAAPLWPALMLAMAGVVFLALSASDVHAALTRLHAGVLATIEPQPPWWPLHAIRVMTGNAAFWPLLAALAVALWSASSILSVRFVLLWTLVPFALVELISYLITPLMLERYVLLSLLGCLLLAGIGLAVLPDARLRYLILGLIVVFSLSHAHHHWRARDDVQWREAANFALSAAPPSQPIAVLPPFEPILAMRYYVAPEARDRLMSAPATLDKNRVWQLTCTHQAPLLIAQTELPRATLAEAAACYPRLLATFRLVEVRAQ